MAGAPGTFGPPVRRRGVSRWGRRGRGPGTGWAGRDGEAKAESSRPDQIRD